MSVIRISATSARNKFFELLNQIALGAQVIIEKDNKEIAVLSPKISQTDWKGGLRKASLTRIELTEQIVIKSR